MNYNKISGTSINSQTAFIFKEFENEQMFLGMSRSDNTWGTCALVNITFPDIVLPADIPATVNNCIGSAGLFYDKKTTGYTEEKSIVQFYKAYSSTEFRSIKNSDLIDRDIYLDYLNSNWAVLRNLPPDYNRYLNVSNNDTFYIVPKQNGYPDTLPADVLKLKINVRSMFNFSDINEPVSLIVSSPAYGAIPRTEKKIIHSLMRTTNILGESFVQGLNDSNLLVTEEELLGYANEDMDIVTGAYFYLSNSRNMKVSQNMFILKEFNAQGKETVFNYDTSVNGDTIGSMKISSDSVKYGNNFKIFNNEKVTGNKYLLFKSNFSEQDLSVKTFYTKVCYNIPETDLAVYHESLPFLFPSINSENNVSDANPPGLSLSYIRNRTLSSSIFEINQYIRIKKAQLDDQPSSIYSKVSYVKELRSTNEENRYAQLGFNGIDQGGLKRIESMIMTSTEPIVRYGNVAPKPNGLPYYKDDTTVYLWSNDFVVGDQIVIIRDITNSDSPTFSTAVLEVNYEFNYIILADVIGDEEELVLLPSKASSIYSESAQIKLQAESNVINIIKYAVCDKLDDALVYGMENVMVELHIPKDSNSTLYQGFYRQLFVSHRPFYYDTISSSVQNCGDANIDNFNSNLYIEEEHNWNCGTIIFLANKTPTYRKIIANKEVYKLIV